MRCCVLHQKEWHEASKQNTWLSLILHFSFRRFKRDCLTVCVMRDSLPCNLARSFAGYLSLFFTSISAWCIEILANSTLKIISLPRQQKQHRQLAAASHYYHQQKPIDKCECECGYQIKRTKRTTRQSTTGEERTSTHHVATTDNSTSSSSCYDWATTIPIANHDHHLPTNIITSYPSSIAAAAPMQAIMTPHLHSWSWGWLGTCGW